MDTLAKFSRDAVNFFKSLFEEDQEQKYQQSDDIDAESIADLEAAKAIIYKANSCSRKELGIIQEESCPDNKFSSSALLDLNIARHVHGRVLTKVRRVMNKARAWRLVFNTSNERLTEIVLDIAAVRNQRFYLIDHENSYV